MCLCAQTSSVVCAGCRVYVPEKRKVVQDLLANLTWTCHGCGDERPDAAISVMSRELELLAGLPWQVNLRYCNDRPQCAGLVVERLDEMITTLQNGAGDRAIAAGGS